MISPRALAIIIMKIYKYRIDKYRIGVLLDITDHYITSSIFIELLVHIIHCSSGSSSSSGSRGSSGSHGSSGSFGCHG